LVDAWLEADRDAPRKQRHTAKRIHRRLVDEYGAEVAEVTVYSTTAPSGRLNQANQPTRSGATSTRRAGASASRRSQLVLLAADGLRNDQIAARLNCRREVVSQWRKRFFEHRVAGLEDLPRRGRPRLSPPSGTR